MIVLFIARILPFNIISMFFLHYQSLIQYFLIYNFEKKEHYPGENKYTNKMLQKLYNRIAICLIPYFAILFPFEFNTEHLLKNNDIRSVLLIFNSIL
mmetsp:Transcript_26019/g.23038  ORF Transcript_26019/g.23038 Transcript_26019/m.23038 type:complete len:97 (+) Transcript_26019:1725-2015(+)